MFFKQALLSMPSKHRVLLPSAQYYFQGHSLLLMDMCSWKGCHTLLTVPCERVISPRCITIKHDYVNDIRQVPFPIQNITLCKNSFCKICCRFLQDAAILSTPSKKRGRRYLRLAVISRKLFWGSKIWCIAACLHSKPLAREIFKFCWVSPRWALNIWQWNALNIFEQRWKTTLTWGYWAILFV